MRLELPKKELDYPFFIDYDELYTINTNKRYFNQENTRRIIETFNRQMTEIIRNTRRNY